MTTALRLDAVVLAAGAGRRFGGEKLTSEWGNRGVLLNGALAAAFAAPVQKVRVIVGADGKVQGLAEAFADAAGQRERLEIVAAEWAHGMSRSLQAGIRLSNLDGCDGAFVFLGDMPRIPASIYGEMIEALDHGAIAVAPEFHGRRGHPVLFSRSMFDEILALEGDKGANGLLDALGERLTTVVAPDDGVLFDVDFKA